MRSYYFAGVLSGFIGGLVSAYFVVHLEPGGVPLTPLSVAAAATQQDAVSARRIQLIDAGGRTRAGPRSTRPCAGVPRSPTRSCNGRIDNVAADRVLEIEPHVAIAPTHEPPAAIALDHLVLVERLVVLRSAVAPPSGFLDRPPGRRPVTIDRDDAAVHLYEELQRLQEPEEVRGNIRRAFCDRMERSTGLPHAVVVPKGLEYGDIASVDGIRKRVSESPDRHFVGDLVRLRPDTDYATRGVAFE